MSDREVGKIEGWIEVEVRDKDGRLKHYLGPRLERREEEDCLDTTLLTSITPMLQCFYWRKNIITNVGLACVIRLIFSGLTETKFGYMAIGTGTNPESATDTALQSEIARKACTVTQTTTNVTGDTALCEATFSKTDGLSGTSAVSEVGIFNAPSGGSLLCRKVFPSISVNWDAGDMITIRYYVQMSR